MDKFPAPARKIPTKRLSDRNPHATLSEMVESSAERFGDETAYLIPRQGVIARLTYGDVIKRVSRLARHMGELGLGRGDKIAILGENRPEWAIAFFATAWIGAVAVPLDSRAREGAWRTAIEFSDAKAAVCSGQFLKRIEALKEITPRLRRVISMEDVEGVYREFSKGAARESTAPEDVMEILFTSGATGDPKGVMLTNLNVISNVEDMYRILDLSTEDRTFSILPIHHVYESTIGIVSSFRNGISVFFARSLKSREMLEDLAAARPTLWLNTPLILEKMLTRIRREIDEAKGLKRALSRVLPQKALGGRIKNRLGLDRIRFIVSGGAALPQWVSSGFEELGFPLLQGYGLSEAAPLISINPPERPKNESVGLVIPSTDIEIRDADSDGNGEIFAKGPNIMKGYHKNDSGTGEALTPDGWLRTGDVGCFDGEGYLYITGRKKFVIVTPGGKNVFPEEIEEKLGASPCVEEAVVFSPDDESVQAIIRPALEETHSRLERLGLAPSVENIWRLIKEEVGVTNRLLEPYKRIRRFAIKEEEFVKTTTGKIKREEFRGAGIEPNTRVYRGGGRGGASD